jgi:hypothetical protein
VILLAGIPSEPPLAMLRTRLEEMGAPIVVLNQRNVAEIRLCWSTAGGRLDGHLWLGGTVYALDGFAGIYARLMDDRLLPELDGESPDSPARRQSRRLHDLLVQWIDVAPGRVVNRFRLMGSNGSKPYQAQLIRRTGLRVPDTLITNDPERLAAFRRRHDRVVFKSISGIRSVVTELDAGDELDRQRVEALRACPVQFQAYVPGFDVRVHVIGAEVIATRVDSTGTDYRYAARDGLETTLRPWQLDPRLADACVALSAALGLAFSGIDLRITPDGDVVCFEVNPSPAYSYYEANAGQPISKALARYLLGGNG